MKYTTIFFALTIVSIIGISSCYDDGTDPLTSTELLAGDTNSGKIWRITAIELEGLGSIDPYICLQDNNITYFRSGRYEVNEGTTKCNIDDPPGLQGSWNLSEREATITILLPDSTMTWDVELLRGDIHRITADFQGGRRTYVLEAIN